MSGSSYEGPSWPGVGAGSFERGFPGEGAEPTPLMAEPGTSPKAGFRPSREDGPGGPVVVVT